MGLTKNQGNNTSAVIMLMTLILIATASLAYTTYCLGKVEGIVQGYEIGLLEDCGSELEQDIATYSVSPGQLVEVTIHDLGYSEELDGT